MEVWCTSHICPFPSTRIIRSPKCQDASSTQKKINCGPKTLFSALRIRILPHMIITTTLYNCLFWKFEVLKPNIPYLCRNICTNTWDPTSHECVQIYVQTYSMLQNASSTVFTTCQSITKLSQLEILTEEIEKNISKPNISNIQKYSNVIVS